MSSLRPNGRSFAFIYETSKVVCGAGSSHYHQGYTMQNAQQADRLSIGASVLADSVYDGSRLTTFEITFPRFILAEFNTHRVLSRNSASSRAIPVWKRLLDILTAPFVPLQFGKNKSGMQAAEDVREQDLEAARQNWLVGRDTALIQAYYLAGGQDQILNDAKGQHRAIQLCADLFTLSRRYPDVTDRMKQLSVGVHKQHANRVLEPYAWHTVIVTGTNWRNFYALRASKMAQPEIKDVALAMIRAQMESVPQQLEVGDWHLPLVFDEDRAEISDLWKLARISSARCARVSYLTHDGKRSLDKDFSMADDLQGNGHMSPFEHPAKAEEDADYCGNFSGKWMQYRKSISNDDDFSRLISRESLLEGMQGDEKMVEFVLSLPA